jgi:uracil-DNA glycosylase family 4
MFDPDCRRCDRLATFLDQVVADYPNYHARPVPPFGDSDARLLVVGLAPGMHGANATGRPFTGDHAGILLYETLYRHGFASAPESVSADDDLKLFDCRITNAVKCLPPQNKPIGREVNNCRRFLEEEMAQLQAGGVILALGSIAHKSVVAGMGLKQKDFVFSHAAEHVLPEHKILLDSYHCSRYNTQTRRLTPEMFDTVFARARALIDG